MDNGTIMFTPFDYYTRSITTLDGTTTDGFMTFENVRNTLLSSDNDGEFTATINGVSFGAYVDERLLFSEEDEIEDVDLPVEYML